MGASNETSRNFHDIIWSVLCKYVHGSTQIKLELFGDEVPGLTLKRAAQTVATVVQLPFSSLPVTIRTTRFNIPKFYVV